MVRALLPRTQFKVFQMKSEGQDLSPGNILQDEELRRVRLAEISVTSVSPNWKSAAVLLSRAERQSSVNWTASYLKYVVLSIGTTVAAVEDAIRVAVANTKYRLATSKLAHRTIFGCRADWCRRSNAKKKSPPQKGCIDNDRNKRINNQAQARVIATG